MASLPSAVRSSFGAATETPRARRPPAGSGEPIPRSSALARGLAIPCTDDHTEVGSPRPTLGSQIAAKSRFRIRSTRLATLALVALALAALALAVGAATASATDGTFKRMWGWGVKDGTAAFQICL